MILVKVVLFKSMLGPLFLVQIPLRVHDSVAFVINLKGGARLRVLVGCPLAYWLCRKLCSSVCNGLPDGDG